MALHDEGAVDGEAEPLTSAALLHPPAGVGDGLLQRRDPGPGVRGRVYDRGLFEKCALNQLANLHFHDFAGVGVHEIGLGQRDDAVTEAEQAEDFEVLARLRHDGVVGGDDEEGEIDAGGAGEHVLDEAFVAGHVHDAEVEGRQVEVGEADVDGDAAGLLFGEAVAVDAGEGLDERGLAVVDVAGGAEDQVAGHPRLLAAGGRSL